MTAKRATNRFGFCIGVNESKRPGQLVALIYIVIRSMIDHEALVQTELITA